MREALAAKGLTYQRRRRADMLTAIPCTLMRGGTSKGLYFHADRPAGEPRAARPRAARGHGLARRAPDRRRRRRASAHQQGRGHLALRRVPTPTSTICSCRWWSTRPKSATARTAATFSPASGRGPSRTGWCPSAGATTPVRIHMVNTGSLAVAHVRTPRGAVEYEGEARIDGVPGTAAPIALEFLDVAGSSCGVAAADGQRDATPSKASRSPASTTACRWSSCAPRTSA